MLACAFSLTFLLTSSFTYLKTIKFVESFLIWLYISSYLFIIFHVRIIVSLFTYNELLKFLWERSWRIVPTSSRHPESCALVTLAQMHISVILYASAQARQVSRLAQYVP